MRALKYYVDKKALLETLKNKVNENKVLYCKALRNETNKKNQNSFPLFKLTNLLSLQLDFQKMDQHSGGKWLFHGTKHRNDNQLQSLELPCRIS